MKQYEELRMDVLLLFGAIDTLSVSGENDNDTDDQIWFE